ncbi:MAG: DUF4136 domain-containing protein [Steroidobacteraceae bacterium]
MSSRLYTAAGFAVMLIALGGCATTASPVRVDKGDADLAKCRTFDWLPASGEAASFTEQRVRTAALQQLQEKGYTVASEKPDCRIAYVLSSYERSKSKPSIGVGGVGGSGGVRGGIGVSVPIGRRNERAGTFTLDVVDVAQNAQIWSGSIDASFGHEELSEDEAREAVRIVLAELPDRTTPNQ